MSNLKSGVIGLCALLLIAATGLTQNCCNRVAKAYTFKVDEKGQVSRDKDGAPIIIEVSPSAGTPDAPRTSINSVGNIEDVEECETDESSPDGRRTSCKSGGFEFVCPAGYYLVRKPSKWDHIEIISERGSENHYWLDWYNEVEIYPGTGIYVPTKVTWQVGARSNEGPSGSAGKTKARFVCEVRRLPPR